MELAILWAMALAMMLLVWIWGKRNRRAGYQKPPRRALLAEGFRLVRPFEESELRPQMVPASVCKETPVEQLVSLSLAVQSDAPAPVPEKVEDPEVIHSPT